MGTITVKSVIDRAAQTLNDEPHNTWSLDELVKYYSEAQKAAVLLRPQVNPVTQSVRLVTGSKQTLPDDGYTLITVTRNMGLDTSNAQSPTVGDVGRAIRPTERETEDQINPEWHKSDNSEDDVKHFIYDARNRKTWYCIPPQPATARFVEIVYAKEPAEIELVNGVLSNSLRIELDDIYVPALIAYILHRAYSKEAPIEGQMIDRAGMYFQQFAAMITGETSLLIRQEPGEDSGQTARRISP